MSVVGKIFPIVAIVCAALAAIGWIIFTGAFGYGSEARIDDIRNKNHIELGFIYPAGLLSVPYYFTAVISPFLIILLIVASVLLMVLSKMRVVHAILGAIIYILSIFVVVGAGAVVHDLTSNRFVILKDRQPANFPPYNDVVIAGGIIELIFLGGALTSLVLGYIFKENKDKN